MCQSNVNKVVKEVIIYTRLRGSNRLVYTVNLIFKDLLGLECRVTNDLELFNRADGMIKICYSKDYVPGCIYFYASNILFERKIVAHDLDMIEYKGLVGLYANNNPNSTFPFDPFASAFYIISRYEEFLDTERDEHGRFTAKQSLAYKNGFLTKPIVNLWAKMIYDVIAMRYPDVEPNTRKFNFTPTYDIDSAYAYRHRGFIRTIMGYAKSLLIDKDFRAAKMRTKVLLGLSADPFDTFDYQLKLQREYELNPIYFIQVGEYGKYDKNISIYNRSFCSLIKELADNATVGVHCSYNANGDKLLFRKELSDLQRVTGFDVTKNRQHYLLLSAEKKTYRALINAGIEDDYTMGYADHVGFRAGICTPYKFYDLEYDMVANLTIHPITYMDGTVKDYMRLNINEAKVLVGKLIDEVKAVNGEFISIWHNETLSDQGKWQGWREFYEWTIKTIIRN